MTEHHKINESTGNDMTSESGAKPLEEARRPRLFSRLTENPHTVQTTATLFVLVLMCVVFGMLSDRFITMSNFRNVMLNTSPVIIASCGATLVMIARGLDLSVGSVLAASSVIAATLAINGVQLWIAFPTAVAFGGLVGLTNGMIIARLGVSPIIVTLGMLNITRGMAYLITPSAILVGLPRNWSDLGVSRLLTIPVPVLIAAVVVLLLHFVMTSTTFGKRIYAIGGNEEASRLSGINVQKMLIILYVICGSAAALAGIVLSSRVGSGDPNIGVGFELQVIAAIIIGGTSLSGGEGRIFGTVIGALIMGVLANGLNIVGVEPFWQLIAQGLVLIAAIIIDRQLQDRVMNMKKAN